MMEWDTAFLFTPVPLGTTFALPSSFMSDAPDASFSSSNDTIPVDDGIFEDILPAGPAPPTQPLENGLRSTQVAQDVLTNIYASAASVPLPSFPEPDPEEQPVSERTPSVVSSCGTPDLDIPSDASSHTKAFGKRIRIEDADEVGPEEETLQSARLAPRRAVAARNFYGEKPDETAFLDIDDSELEDDLGSGIGQKRKKGGRGNNQSAKRPRMARGKRLKDLYSTKEESPPINKANAMEVDPQIKESDPTKRPGYPYWGAEHAANPPPFVFKLIPAPEVGLHKLVDPPPGERPGYNYITLIKYAILGSPQKKLRIEDILEQIMGRFEYFRNAEQKLDKGWKNSVRHQLSLSSVFKKKNKEIWESGRGIWWTVDESVEDTELKRERKRNPRSKAGIVAKAAKEQAAEALRPQVPVVQKLPVIIPTALASKSIDPPRIRPPVGPTSAIMPSHPHSIQRKSTTKSTKHLSLPSRPQVVAPKSLDHSAAHPPSLLQSHPAADKSSRDVRSLASADPRTLPTISKGTSSSSSQSRPSTNQVRQTNMAAVSSVSARRYVTVTPTTTSTRAVNPIFAVAKSTPDVAAPSSSRSFGISRPVSGSASLSAAPSSKFAASLTKDKPVVQSAVHPSLARIQAVPSMTFSSSSNGGRLARAPASINVASDDAPGSSQSARDSQTAKTLQPNQAQPSFGTSAFSTFSSSHPSLRPSKPSIPQSSTGLLSGTGNLHPSLQRSNIFEMAASIQAAPTFRSAPRFGSSSLSSFADLAAARSNPQGVEKDNDKSENEKQTKPSSVSFGKAFPAGSFTVMPASFSNPEKWQSSTGSGHTGFRFAVTDAATSDRESEDEYDD